ncbi:MAG: hypothetical protein KN64_15005 [Sulfurovum sp. AS07-7]|nr:MAG: hypothetical protein KN64_15005 [Sulfurovum sp. AS07-7]
MRSFIIFMIVIALANSKSKTPVKKAKVLTPLVAKECNQKVSSLLGVVLSSHPSIAMSQEIVNGNKAGLEGAKWSYYPTPSVDMSQTSKNTQMTFRIDQPLWTGGKLDAGYDIASSKVDEATIALDESRYKLIDNFLNILQTNLQSKAQIKALSDGKADLERLGAMLERRINAGVSAPNDRQLLDSRLNAIDADLDAAKNRYRISKMQLELLMSKKMECAIDTNDKLHSFENLEPIAHKMLEVNPALKKLDAQIATSGFELDKAKVSLYPNISLRAERRQGSLYSSDLSSNENLVYIAVSASTGAGLSYLSTVDAQKSKIAQIQLEKQTKSKELLDSLMSDHNNYSMSTSKIKSLKQAIVSGKKVQESFHRLFLASRKQWLDLVNASKEVMQNEIELSNQQTIQTISRYKLALKNGNINLNTGMIE